VQVDADGFKPTAQSPATKLLELKLCRSSSADTVHEVLDRLAIRLQLGRARVETLLNDLVLLQRHNAHNSAPLSVATVLARAELLLRCFLLRVPGCMIQRLFQAMVLLESGGSDRSDGQQLLRFLTSRLHSAMSSFPDAPQLQWFVERTTSLLKPQTIPLEDLQRGNVNLDDAHRCSNPMCPLSIQAVRGSHTGTSQRLSRYEAAGLHVTLNEIPSQPESKSSLIVCWKCAATPQTVFTTRQFPLGFKHCASCRCFHRLHEFTSGPWQLERKRPAFATSCTLSRRHYNNVTWNEQAARLPKVSAASRNRGLSRALLSAADDTTTIGPYADPRHSRIGSLSQSAVASRH